MLLCIDRCVSVKDVTSHEPQEEEDEEPRNGRYTLKSVKKIDHYSRHKMLSGFKTKRFFSRRIFAGTYITFALYFFIRYHAIEGALSIDLME